MTRNHAICAALVALAGVSALKSTIEPSYQIAGIVVDSRSRLPIPNALVSLAATPPQSRQLEQITNRHGQFSFVVAQAGKYQLQISKPGYPPQSYSQPGFALLSSAIVVREGQDTSHLIFEASRGSAISGRLLDEDSEPVNDADVVVLQALVTDGEHRIVCRGQMRVNASGEFRFANLRSGDYYVLALGRPWFAGEVYAEEQSQSIVNSVRQRMVTDVSSARPPAAPVFSPDPNLRGSAFAPAFYPEAQTLAEASAVHLDVGRESQITILLRPVPAVSVRVRLGVSGGTNTNSVNLVKEIAGEDVLFAAGFPLSKEGVFEFHNVPRGSYVLVASTHAGPDASPWKIRKHIVVGASDTEIMMNLPPRVSLYGHVLVKDNPKLPAGLLLSFRDQSGNVSQAVVDTHGSFFVRGLAAGKYVVSSNLTSYIPMYALSPSGHPLPLPVEIPSGTAVRRDLVLAQAGAEIKGIVDRSGAPCAGSFVLLMPQGFSPGPVRIDQTNTDGSFQIAAIPAGDYFLIALSDGADLAYRNAEVALVLEKAAREIHVEANHVLEVRLDLMEAATLPAPPR